MESNHAHQIKSLGLNRFAIRRKRNWKESNLHHNVRSVVFYSLNYSSIEQSVGIKPRLLVGSQTLYH